MSAITEHNRRLDFIAALRDVAKILEENETIPIPYNLNFYHRCDTKNELIALTKAWGGRFDKDTDGDDFNMRRKLGGAVSVCLYVSREKVCKKIVTGKKEIAEQIIPANDERIIPAHTEEIIEWVCPDSLFEESVP